MTMRAGLVSGVLSDRGQESGLPLRNEDWRSGDGPLLERLREDLVQREAAARLHMELAVRQKACGGSGTVALKTARRIRKGLARQACLWRRLVFGGGKKGPPRKIDLTALADDFTELMQTEARVRSIRLLRIRSAPLRVSADREMLARKLLRAFLSVLENSPRGTTVEVRVLAAGQGGRIVLMDQNPDESARSLGVVEAPLPA